MANLVLTRRYPRGEPDNTATFAASAVTPGLTLARRQAAIEAWQSTRTRGRTWYRASMPGVSSGFVAVDTSTWVAVDQWLQSGRTPARNVPFPDQGDAWSFGAAAPDFAALFPALEFWRSDTTRRAARLDPRRVPRLEQGRSAATTSITRALTATGVAGSSQLLIPNPVAQRWPAIEWGTRAERTRDRRELDPRFLGPLDGGRRSTTVVPPRALVAVGVPNRVLQTRIVRARVAVGVPGRTAQALRVVTRALVATGVVGASRSFLSGFSAASYVAVETWTQSARLWKRVWSTTRGPGVSGGPAPTVTITRNLVATGVAGSSQVFIPAAFTAAYYAAIDAWSRAGRTAKRVPWSGLRELPWLAKPSFQFVVTRALTGTGVVVRVLQTRLTRARVAVGVVTHATQFVRLITRALVAVGVPHRILQTQLVPHALVAHGLAAVRRQTQVVRALLEFAAAASVRQTRKTRALGATGVAHLAVTRFTMVTRALIAHGIAGFQALYLPFSAGLGNIYVNILRRRRRKKD